MGLTATGRKSLISGLVGILLILNLIAPVTFPVYAEEKLVEYSSPTSEGLCNMEKDQGLLSQLNSIEETPVVFSDPNLEEAIRQELNKPIGDITTTIMESLTHLDGSYYDIESLSGLEYAVNLSELELAGNNLDDISNLACLTKLTNLWLDGNNISNIDSVSGLTSLEWLRLRDNHITDISSLSTLTNLVSLRLSNNEISNLPDLTALSSLEELSLDHNSISDASNLSVLTSLNQLDLEANQISDISSLTSLSNLQTLRLNHNTIDDITALADLNSLNWLDLEYNQINDISALIDNLGFGSEDYLYIAYNRLDTTIGSDDMQNISTIETRGAYVDYEPQYNPDKPPVSIEMIDEEAAESGFNTGKFKVFLPLGAVSQDVIISYTIDGTAQNGIDYDELSGLATISLGQTEALIDINPIDDEIVEGYEFVQISLSEGDSYTLLSTYPETVTIVDDDKGNIVNFNDANLQEAVIDALSYQGTETGEDIYQGDLLNLVFLDASYQSIQDLTGLEYALNLIDLNLSNNYIADIMPLVTNKMNGGLHGWSQPDPNLANQLSTVAPEKFKGILTNQNQVQPSQVDISSNLLDLNGDDMGDIQYLIDNGVNVQYEPQNTSATPYIEISASDEVAAEPGSDTATFMVSLINGNAEVPTTVNYTVSGTAINGTDYDQLTGTVTIPIGEDSAPIIVTPIDDNELEVDETVFITLVEADAYNLGETTDAEINIKDNDVPVVIIEATDDQASEPGTDTAEFKVSITNGKALRPLTVDHIIGGTADNGIDYEQLSGSVIISAGSSSAYIGITPLNDSESEETETIIITVQNSADYTVGTLSSSTVYLEDHDNLVSFTDPNLEIAIGEVINKAPGTITQEDMLSLTSLELNEKNINDLTGLQYASNLTSLSLNGNTIEDFSQLGELHNLAWLDLCNNNITDISGLSNLTKLVSLRMNHNHIENLTPLEELHDLEVLELWDNNITDISSLSNLIKLTCLRLDQNNIEYVDALANLTELSWDLDLSDNNITDITPLSSLNELRYLDLSHNHIANIEALESMSDLGSLQLMDNNIQDITPLQNLHSLYELRMWENNIQDISALSGLTNLENLNIDYNHVSNISPLANLTKLKQLGLQDIGVSNISPLSNLTNLEQLYLWYNSVTDISALSGMTKLVRLDLGENEVTDISPLSDLLCLDMVRLSDNHITDIAPLVLNCTNGGLGSGSNLDINGNYLDLDSSSDDMQNIQILLDRGVDVDYQWQEVPNDNSLTINGVNAGQEVKVKTNLTATVTGEELTKVYYYLVDQSDNQYNVGESYNSADNWEVELDPSKYSAGTYQLAAVGIVKGTGDRVYAPTISISIKPPAAPLAVSSTDPANNATGVTFDKSITITFNQNIEPGTNYDDITVSYLAINKVHVDGTKTITLNHPAAMNTNTKYTVTIPAGAVNDENGTPLANSYTFSFTTLDNIAPTILSTVPANNATDIALDSKVKIFCSEPVTLVGNPYQNYMIQILNTGSNNSPVAFNATTDDNQVIVNRSSGNWNSKTTYLVKVHSGAVKDTSGNELATNAEFRFTTMSIPAKPSFYTSPGSPVTGQAVQFTSTSQAGDDTITATSWDFGDGDTATGKNATHTYINPGNYTVTLTITLGSGATKTATKSLTIYAPADMQLSINPQNPNPGQTVSFDVSGAEQPGKVVSSYNWFFGDGNADAGLKNPFTTHVYNKIGNYTVTLKIKYTDGTTLTYDQNISVCSSLTLTPASFNTGSNGGSATMNGPQVSFGGKNFGLFNLPIGIDLSLIDEVKASYDPEEQKWEVVIGDLESDAEGYQAVKKVVNLCGRTTDKEFYNNFRSLQKNLRAKKVKMGCGYTSYTAGYMEIRNINGQPQITEGGIVFVASAEGSMSYPLPPAPVAYVKFSIEGEVNGRLSLKAVDSGRIDLSGQLGLDVTTDLGIGAGKEGLASAEAGLEGKLETELELLVTSLQESFSAKLSASLYLKYEVLMFINGKNTWQFWETELYPNFGQSSMEKINIDPDEFILMPRDYGDGERLNIQSLESFSSLNSTTVKSNVFPYGEPQLLELGNGEQMLIWVDDDTERSSANRTSLMYSTYDGSSWSSPEYVNDDGTADFAPRAVAKNGEVYLAWQNANTTFADTVTMEEMAQGIDISYARFDNAGFTDITNLTDQEDTVYEMSPVISSDGSAVSIAWIENTFNDSFGLSGSNSIVKKTISAGTWGDSLVLVNDIPLITSIDTAYDNGSNYIAYCADTDGDSTTNNDAEIFLLQESALTQVTDDDVDDSSVQFVSQGDNAKLYWHSGSEIKYISAEGSGYVDALPLTIEANRMKNLNILGNDNGDQVLIWEQSDGFKNELYASYYDSSNDQWGEEVKLTSLGNHIRQTTAYLDNDNNIQTAFDLSQVLEINESNSEPYGATDLIAATFGREVNLTIDGGIYYDESKIQPNANIILYLNVKNNSADSITQVEADILDADETLLSTQTIDTNIASGATQEIAIPYTLPSTISKQELKVEVRPAGATDIDMSDNTATVTIGLADITIQNTEVLGGNAPSQILANIQNIGYDDATGIIATLQRDGSDGEILATQNLSDITPEAYQEITFDIDPAWLDFASEQDNKIFYLTITTESQEALYSNNSSVVVVSPPHVEQVTMDQSSLELIVGEDAQLSATVAPDEAINHEVFWVSENEAAAIVDQTGTVTGVGKGQTTITAVSVDGNKMASCEVTVQSRSTYGDVNSDSSVNITDAVLVLKYITNPTIQIDLTAADVNGDSTTNITDAVLILKHITNPTVPFPVEG